MSVGIWQLLLILVVVFVLFGAGKLPQVMGDLGKGLRELKKGAGKPDEPGEVNLKAAELEPVTLASEKEKAKGKKK